MLIHEGLRDPTMREGEKEVDQKIHHLMLTGVYVF